MAALDSLFDSLGFMGAGNMAGAILRGTVGRGLLSAERTWACDVVAEKLGALRDELGIRVTGDARELVRSAQHVVLAVKPQNLMGALDAIADCVTPGHLLISIAAGVPLRAIAARLPAGTRLVRVMPNTPALVGAGASAAAAGEHAAPGDLEKTLALFGAVGLALEVEEKDLDAVTALSGSGPAYVFRFMELLMEAGVEMGLSPEASRRLTLQTFLGASQLASQSAEDAAELRRRVTSPGGTTAAALAVFEEQGLAGIFKAGVMRARDRSIELAKGR